ncbi:MAG TPA: peptidylprolyl isomerase [bacterium]|nr:peptidylprolyl isomerase [bacterium]
MRYPLLLLAALVLMACSRAEDRNIIYLFKGEATTVAEFRRDYENWLAQSGRADSRELRHGYLESRVMEELLYRKGMLEGVEYLPDVRERINDYRRQVVIEKTRDMVDRSLYPIEDEEIKNYYVERRDEFVRDRLYRLYAVRTKKKERAFEAYDLLTTQGASIRLLSARYSDDKRLADRNGDWGLFSEDVMDEHWREELSGKRIGDIVGPVRDSENYWIVIEIAGFAYKREIPFERAYPLILRKLRERMGGDDRRAHREKLLREYGVRINENNLDW